MSGLILYQPFFVFRSVYPIFIKISRQKRLTSAGLCGGLFRPAP
nr:MAG TPA: hypothetical protein [Caudoviricetes sp.]